MEGIRFFCGVQSHWNEFLGKLMVSAMSLVLNYIMSKLFIFKKKKDEEKEHGAG